MMTMRLPLHEGPNNLLTDRSGDTFGTLGFGIIVSATTSTAPLDTRVQWAHVRDPRRFVLPKDAPR